MNDLEKAFHKVWTKAASAPDYVKADWTELQRILFPEQTEADRVTAAKMEILAEDEAARRIDTPERQAQVEENRRRNHLPSEARDHICGMMCDGQDGASSYCARLRRKLFGPT